MADFDASTPSIARIYDYPLGGKLSFAAGREAYIDSDPVVLRHLHALAAKGDPGVTVVDADLREGQVIAGVARVD